MTPDSLSSGQSPAGHRWPLLIHQNLTSEADFDGLCARILIQAGYRELRYPACWSQDLRCVHSLASSWLLETRARIASHALFDRSRLAKTTTDPGRLNRQQADSVGLYRRILSSLSNVSSRLSPSAALSWVTQPDVLESRGTLGLTPSLLRANDQRLLNQVVRLFRASAVTSLDPGSLLPFLADLRLELRVRRGLSETLFCKTSHPATQFLRETAPSAVPGPLMTGAIKTALDCDFGRDRFR